MIRYCVIFCLLAFTACQDNSALEQEIASLKAALVKAEADLAAMPEEPVEPGLIHYVFFWLKEDLSQEDETAFVTAVEELKAIKAIKNCYIGPPAATEARDVVDNSYSYALIVHFDDIASQDAYQVDPIHTKFVEENKDKWTKVIVYDNEVQD